MRRLASGLGPSIDAMRLIAADRDLRWLLLGWFAVWAGKGGFLVVNSVTAFAAGGPVAVGLLGLASYLPPAILSPFAGVPAARWPRGTCPPGEPRRPRRCGRPRDARHVHRRAHRGALRGRRHRGRGGSRHEAAPHGPAADAGADAGAAHRRQRELECGRGRGHVPGAGRRRGRPGRDRPARGRHRGPGLLRHRGAGHRGGTRPDGRARRWVARPRPGPAVGRRPRGRAPARSAARDPRIRDADLRSWAAHGPHRRRRDRPARDGRSRGRRR